jgi:hypothetical protein
VLTNTSAAPITGFSADATFQYLPADVTGTESQLYCTKVAPDPVITYAAANTGAHTLSASGLTTFSTFTGTKGALTSRLFAYLEGPYNSSSNLMNTTLRDAGKLPLTQPYNTPPWNYAGTESVAAIPADVVDWVLVQLRQAGTPATATAATIFATRAGFLKKDGSIVDIDGASDIKWYNSAVTSSLYPVILHRNHLAIMANNAVTATAGIYMYDYTTAQSQIYDGTGSGCIALVPSSGPTKWGLVGGDADASGLVNNNDLFNWQANFSSSTYNSADFDMSGLVNNNDLFLWQRNFSAAKKVPN